VIRILWLSLLASTFVYLGVMFFAVQPPLEPPDQMMALALAMAGLSTAAVSLVMPRIMLKGSLSQMQLPTREVADPNASLVMREQAPKLLVYEDLKAARGAVAAKFFTPFILGMAMSEAVVIYGLVLGFLGFAPTITLPFFVVGWALMLTRFPREDAILRQAEEITGVRFLDPAG